MLNTLQKNPRTRFLAAFAALIVYAASVNLFVVPAGLYTGGLLGFCQVLRTLLVQAGVSVPFDLAGVLYWIVNVPILIIAWRIVSGPFVMRTVVGTAISSFFLAVIPAPAVPFLSERLANCLVGGILSGFALGIILTCGYSSGGLDVVGLVMAKLGKNFTVGRFSIGFNAVLYTVCMILFDVTTAIYSVICMVFTSLFIDRAHQQSINVQMLIFTRAPIEEISEQITHKLERGVTYWDGCGAYTGERIRVLCVCLSKFEVAAVQKIVLDLDEHAFFTLQEGVHIRGNFHMKVS